MLRNAGPAFRGFARGSIRYNARMNPLHIAPPRRRPNRTWWVALLLITAGCGGGGGSESSAATTGGSLAITGPAITPVGAADTGNTLAVAVDASTFVAANTPEPAIADVPVVVTTAAAPALPVAPTLPRAGLGAQDLTLLVAEGDAQGEAIARAYQLVRGIPDAQVPRLPVPPGSDVIGDSAFATLKAQLDARLPATVQATLVTWTQPSRVQGSSCSMGITSALAFGYNAMLCGGCNRTQASAYFDTDTTRPYSDLRIRPSMMLGAATLEAAQALIARGLAAEGSAPSGSSWAATASCPVRWPTTSPPSAACCPRPAARCRPPPGWRPAPPPATARWKSPAIMSRSFRAPRC